MYLPQLSRTARVAQVWGFKISPTVSLFSFYLYFWISVVALQKVLDLATSTRLLTFSSKMPNLHHHHHHHHHHSKNDEREEGEIVQCPHRKYIEFIYQ